MSQRRGVGIIQVGRDHTIIGGKANGTAGGTDQRSKEIGQRCSGTGSRMKWGRRSKSSWARRSGDGFLGGGVFVTFGVPFVLVRVRVGSWCSPLLCSLRF